MTSSYVINVGQLTESTRKPDIISVLNDIQDNTQKLISPRDVRDAFLSTWANSPFKVTTPNTLANFEYIGIDSNNPANKDIKLKILLGKRSFGNLDVMNSSLLGSNDSDIFLFNTKPDTADQSSTKVSILAGTFSLLYPNSPYIEGKVNTAKTAVDLNIVNPAPSGGINILSTTGRVSINNIIFPTVAETIGSASNGRILRYRGNYPSGYLRWEEPTITLNNIGTPGYSTDIVGTTVSVNGYPIEFIEPDYVPTTIGGINQGRTFPNNSFFNGTGYQNWPLTVVLKELLYPYTKPELSLSVVNTVTGTTYAEIGTTPSCVLTYKITTFQRNTSERIINYGVTPQTSYVNLSLSGVPGTSAGATISVATYSSTLGAKQWLLRASDSGNPTSFSYSATASLNFVYPVFYGFTSSLITNTSFSSIVPTLKKAIIPYPGVNNTIELPFSGDGYMYFIHHKDNTWVSPTSSNPGLQQIKDHNGFIVHNIVSNQYSGFTSSIINSVINGYANAAYPENFVVWRTKYKCAYPGLSSSLPPAIFKFLF